MTIANSWKTDGVRSGAGDEALRELDEVEGSGVDCLCSTARTREAALEVGGTRAET